MIALTTTLVLESLDGWGIACWLSSLAHSVTGGANCIHAHLGLGIFRPVCVQGGSTLPYHVQAWHSGATLPSEEGAKGDINHVLSLSRVPACEISC